MRQRAILNSSITFTCSDFLHYRNPISLRGIISLRGGYLLKGCALGDGHSRHERMVSYPILFFRPNFGVFRRKTMLSLSQISKYPFQEFWCVVFQELEKALDRVFFVESVKDIVNNDEAPMLIRQRMNQRIGDRILFVPAVETLAFLSGSFLHIVSLGNKKTN